MKQYPQSLNVNNFITKFFRIQIVIVDREHYWIKYYIYQKKNWGDFVIMDIPVPVLWIVSGTLAFLGSWIIIVNYICAIRWYVRRKHSSMIPLLGGVLFALGMLHCPMPEIKRLAWLPLVFDLGCLYTLLNFIYAVFVLKLFKK